MGYIVIRQPVAVLIILGKPRDFHCGDILGAIFGASD
jgi:hypothetical protein